MPASQEQKVDFLLKKIGYSASKTGIAEDSSLTGSTKKAPFAEAIPSPLVLPASTIWSESGFISATPPSSNTAYVGIYTAANAYRMTYDNTVGAARRTFIARSSYGNQSSSIDGDWIDTQFGADYIVQVYKGDPNSGGVSLQQAGANAGTDGWFFDYSSGVLNFNGTNLPSGIGTDNVYILGYRYIGRKGVQPPAGIGTFHDLIVYNNFSVGGISTFTGKIIANNNIGIGTDNPTARLHISGTDAASAIIKIEDNNNNIAASEINVQNGGRDLRIAAPNDTFFTKVSGGTPILYLENGQNVGIGTDNPGAKLDVFGNTKLRNDVDIDGDLDVDGHTELDNLRVSGIATVQDDLHIPDASKLLMGDDNDFRIYHNESNQLNYIVAYNNAPLLLRSRNADMIHCSPQGAVTLKYDGGTRAATTSSGFDVSGNLNVTGIATLGNIGISTGRITGPAITYIDPATVGDDTGTLVVKGNLQVEGTQTVVNSSTMTVTDKNIELAKGAANDAAADGGGITVDSGDGDKTWQWLDATDSWTSSEHIRISDDKVFGFATDTNTYIGRPAADTIAFTHGGSEKLRIDSNGRLLVSRSGLTASKNVGTKTGEIQVAASGNNAAITLINYSNDASSPYLMLGKSRAGNSTGNTIVQADDRLGEIAFCGADGNDIDSFGAAIKAWVDGTPGNNDMPGRLVFYTTPDGSQTALERLVIKNDGKIGINSINPTNQLDIRGSVGGFDDLRASHSDTVKTYTVTVATKDATHRYQGTGSSKGYKIDGEFSPFITLTPGRTYRFDQSDNSNATHQIKFYLEADKTTLYEGGVTYAGTAGSSGAYTQIVVGDETPVVLHYQCINHGYMGNAVQVNSNVVNTNYDAFLRGNLSVSGVTTFSDGIHLQADVDGSSSTKRIYIGAGDDLTLFHDGANSYLQNHTGDLIIGDTNHQYVRGYTSDKSAALFYNNSNKIQTTNTGVNVTGIITTTQLEIGTLGQSLVGITTILDEDNFASDSAAALATQQSIKAYVDGGASPSSSLAVSADSGSNESINLVTEVLDIEGTANEIETATGTNKVVIGLPDNVTIGNNLTVNNDVGISSNLNVTGISTFSDHIHLKADSKHLYIGASDDFSIQHNGTNTFLRNGEGQIFIQDDQGVNITNVASNKSSANFYPNNGVYLYFNGNQKLRTTNTGVTVTGETETDTLNTGNATFTGTISAGSTTGTDGYYLKTTGVGVTWAQFPTARNSQTFTATAGQTTFSFTYNIGLIDVFVNGVKLPTSEFTANNGTSVILDDGCFVNDTVELITYNTAATSSGGGASNLNGLADITITGSPVVGETLQHNGSEFVNDYTVSATTTSTSQTAILSLPVATYRSAEYTIQVTEGTKYHVTKVLAIHDGTNVTFNEFGTLTTSTSLSTFALDINSGNMRLLATPASTNSTVFKVKFTGIKV